jgi:4-diphosphocytidyl-2-C-methyl-D-erythritol kinase
MQSAKAAGPREIRITAPAKINLGLVIGKQRPDGFHDLETVFVRISLCDDIVIRRAGLRGRATRDQIGLTISDCRPGTSPERQEEILRLAQNDTKRKTAGYSADRKLRPEPRIPNPESPPLPDLPAGHGNLCMRAAHLFLDTAKIREPIEIALTKRIPLGAGLGGGSSDAAAVLKGLNRLFAHPLDAADLHTLAMKLGSDVSFFLHGTACQATGRGEVLKPIHVPELDILLHVPGFPIPTPWAYHELDRLRAAHATPSPSRLTERAFSPMIALARLKAGDYPGFSENLFNSFEDVVFRLHPELKEIKALMLASGADAALLSGSGSALFAVVRASRVRPVQHALEKKRISSWKVRSQD